MNAYEGMNVNQENRLLNYKDLIDFLLNNVNTQNNRTY